MISTKRAVILWSLAFIAGLGFAILWQGSEVAEVVAVPATKRADVDVVAGAANPVRLSHVPSEASSERKGTKTAPVRIPAAALQFFEPLPFFEEFEATLDRRFSEELGLDDTEIARIDAASKNAINALRELEVEKAEVREADVGGEYFFILPLGEAGEKVFETFSNELKSFLDEGTWAMLVDSAQRSDVFSRFGQDAQELSITEEMQRDGAAGLRFDLRYRTGSGSGRSNGGGGRTIGNRERFVTRYGAFFHSSDDDAK